MADINELKINIETLNRASTTELKKQNYNLVQKNLEELDMEFTSLRKDLSLKNEVLEQAKREIVSLKAEYTVLNDRLAKALKENNDLENKLEQLSIARPALSSANLVKAFRDSFEKMDESLNTFPSRVGYQISSMNIKLKTNLSMKDDELRFQLPKSNDIIPAANLSEIEFSISSSHKESPLSGYSKVPNVVGMQMDVAVPRLKDAGFMQGDIVEKESDLPQGTVLSQIPSGFSLARPGEAVDLFVSRTISVEVPGIVGMKQEEAKNLLVGSRLNVGKVTEQADASSPGTVLSQSVDSGNVVDVGTAIDFVVSVSVNKVIEAVAAEKAPSASDSIFVGLARSKAASKAAATRLSTISTITRKEV
ncbi:MAG: eukaryotic-like serine/threonine-protein kinase [Methanolobus sp.]|jgi:serine/threonine-protein kinase|nr:eukaryotic-like serine/threonine-protein kinase [Methanolobus sp.]MDK2911457.1 eukaryotic-like serine/threonine-protein kinase [Methanolobus sp.]